MVSESEVFQSVVDALDARGWDFFIHIPHSYRDHDIYRQIVKEHETHDIKIQGKWPDVIGYNSKREVCAIEIKGSKNVFGGVGQAAGYKAGCHRSYIAAPKNKIAEVGDAARDSSIGLIGISEGHVDHWEEPNTVSNKNYLSDVQRQLIYRLNDWKSLSNISSLRLSKPENFLAPLFILDNGPKKEKRIAKAIQNKYDFHDPYGVLQGSLSLKLVEENDGQFRLTEDGRFALTSLKGEKIRTLSDLQVLKESTSYKRTLYVEYPNISTLLRKQFKEHPEFRSILEVINDFDSNSVTLPEVTRELAMQYPNVYTNIFCASQKQPKATRLLEKQGPEAIHSDLDIWRNLMLQNIYDNFTRQLRQVGILDSRTSIYYGEKEDFPPEEYPWIRPHNWF